MDEGEGMDEESTCRACPKGVKCSEKGAMLETLELEQGYYRPEFKSKKVYQCSSQVACVGGNGIGGNGTDGNGTDRDGREPNYW